MSRFRSCLWGAAGLLIATCTLWAASPPVLKGWGQASDPDGDCRFQQKDGKLTIAVPGTLHNLVADSGQVNSPTVLSPVKGEFIAMVKSTGGVHPGPESNVADGLPYHGTGLLLWVDRDNYFRLERAGLIRDEAFITYVNFEHFKEGRQPSARDMPSTTFPPICGWNVAGEESMRPPVRMAFTGRRFPLWKSTCLTKSRSVSRQ